MKQSPKFRRTTILTVGFLSFLVGLALAHNVEGLGLGWLFVSILLVGLSFVKKSVLALLSISLLGVVLGIMRGSVYLQKLQPYEVLYGQQVTVQVNAETDGVYDDNGLLDFDSSGVKIIKPNNLELPGRIRVKGRGEPAVFRGDIVEVKGKLFPAGGSRQGRITFAEMKVLGRSGFWLEKIRREFVAGMQTALPEPQASFGLGLLVGQRNTLPEEIATQLSIVGLTHVIAVSGYNLTIIVRGTRRVLGKRSKYQSTVLSFVLIAGFLFFTGFSASIVRASIVSVLSIMAWYYGRAFKPLLLISLTAALTAGWNPIYIWSDIGWYLSFLAFFGVLVVAPLIKKRLIGKREQKFLGQVVLESLSAQLMTAPLILYIFSETSLVALLSNVIVVPLVPFAMLFSLVAGLAGMIVPVASGLFAWPANILMTYMLDIVSLMSRIPNAHIERVLSLVGMLLCYALIIAICLILSRRIKAKYGTITDKSIIE